MVLSWLYIESTAAEKTSTSQINPKRSKRSKRSKRYKRIERLEESKRQRGLEKNAKRFERENQHFDCYSE